MDLKKIRYELKHAFENVACLGSHDPKATEYQNRLIDHIMKIIEEETNEPTDN